MSRAVAVRWRGVSSCHSSCQSSWGGFSLRCAGHLWNRGGVSDRQAGLTSSSTLQSCRCGSTSLQWWGWVSLTCIITSVWSRLLRGPWGFTLLCHLPEAFLPFPLHFTNYSCWGARTAADCSWMKESARRGFGIIGLIRPTGSPDWMICQSEDTNAQVWGGQWSIYAPENHQSYTDVCCSGSQSSCLPCKEETGEYCFSFCKINGASVSRWENKWGIWMLTHVVWLGPEVNGIMNNLLRSIEGKTPSILLSRLLGFFSFLLFR